MMRPLVDFLSEHRTRCVGNLSSLSLIAAGFLTCDAQATTYRCEAATDFIRRPYLQEWENQKFKETDWNFEPGLSMSFNVSIVGVVAAICRNDRCEEISFTDIFFAAPEFVWSSAGAVRSQEMILKNATATFRISLTSRPDSLLISDADVETSAETCI